MVREERVTPFINARRAPSGRPDKAIGVKLGLVCAPGLSNAISRRLAAELPALFSRHVDDRVCWDVSVIVDPLTGSERDAPKLLDVCRDRIVEKRLDLGICITDLPVYRNGRLIVADVSAAGRVGGVSLPALGAARVRGHAREVILQLVEALYVRIPGFGKDAPPPTSNPVKDIRPRLTGQRPHRQIKRRRIEILPPFRRVEPPDEDM